MKVVDKIKQELGQDALDVYLQMAKNGGCVIITDNLYLDKKILDDLCSAGYAMCYKYRGLADSELRTVVFLRLNNEEFYKFIQNMPEIETATTLTAKRCL